jgi:copper(I)-binding protein
LHGLPRPLLPGEEVPLLLRLEDGATVSVSARVRALGAG